MLTDLIINLHFCAKKLNKNNHISLAPDYHFVSGASMEGQRSSV